VEGMDNAVNTGSGLMYLIACGLSNNDAAGGTIYCANDAIIRHTKLANAGGGPHLCNDGAGTLTVYSCYAVLGDQVTVDVLRTTGTVTWAQGDRAAYSVENYHAADIEAATPTRHTPLPGAEGQVVRSDGSKWESARLSRCGVAMAWMRC